MLLTDLYPVADVSSTKTGAQNAAAIASLLRSSGIAAVVLPPIEFFCDPINATHLYSPKLIGTHGVGNMSGSGNTGTVIRPNVNDAPILDLTGTIGFIGDGFNIGRQDDVGHVAVLLANSTSRPGAANIFRDVGVGGRWALGGLYNYGTNDNTSYGGGFSNLNGNNFCAIFARDNTYGIQSPFQTIATGEHSCGNWTAYDTVFQNMETNPTNNAGGSIYLRGANSLRLIGSLVAAGGSRVILGSAPASGGSSSITILGGGVYTEQSGNIPYCAYECNIGALTVHESPGIAYNFSTMKARNTGGVVTVLPF